MDPWSLSAEENDAAAQRAADELHRVEAELAKLGRPGIAQEIGLSAMHIEGMKIQLRDMVRQLQTEIAQRQTVAQRQRIEPTPAFGPDASTAARTAANDKRNAEAAETVQKRRAAEQAEKMAEALSKARLEARLTANRLAEEGADGKRRDEGRGRGGMGAQAALAAMAQASGSVQSLARAGDPFSAFPTFEASVRGLSQAVGEAFLPAIEKASEVLQRMEAGFRGLPPVAKDWIAVMGGATLAVGALAAAGRTLTFVAVGLKGALSIGGLINPWLGLAVAATTAATAIFAVKTNALGAGDALRAAGGAMGFGPSPAIDREALKRNLPFSVKKQIQEAGGDDAKVAKIINDFRDKATADLEALKAKQPSDIAKGEAMQKRFNELAAERLPGMQERFRQENPDAIWRQLLRGPLAGPNMDRQNAAGAASKTAAEEIAKALKAAGFDVPKSGITDAVATFLLRSQYAGYGQPGESFADTAGDRTRKARLNAAVDAKSAADQLAEQTGADKFRMKRDFKFPAAMSGDPMQFYDRMQNAVINLAGQEKSTDTLLRQIEAAVKELGGIMTEVKMGTYNVDRGYARGPDRY